MERRWDFVLLLVVFGFWCFVFFEKSNYESEHVPHPVDCVAVQIRAWLLNSRALNYICPNHSDMHSFTYSVMHYGSLLRAN